MQRIGRFLEVAKALQEKKIRFVNLKGPLLSQRIYGDPTYRVSRDFDILVNPEDLNQALYLLEKHGYEPQEFEWPQSPKKQKLARYFLNQIEMVHGETGIALEVHWKLFSTRIIEHEKFDQLLRDHITEYELAGQNLNCFSQEFELFYLVVHGGIHAWFRLKWLVDVQEFMNRKRVDWKKFNQIVSSYKAQKLVDICNTMLKEYFPDGKRLPITGSDAGELGTIALEQCKQPAGDPHETRFNTLRLIRYRMKLFPNRRYKLDVLHVITFCKTDLKYKWLPPYKIVCYLFRPVGYLLRGLGVLK